jgi:hypothetical protein
LRPHYSTVTEPTTPVAFLRLNFDREPSHANRQQEVCGDRHGECEQRFLAPRKFDAAHRVFTGSRCPNTANYLERAA